jgi:hypothetical protein
MVPMPTTMNTKNFPISLILANTVNSFYCNYNCLKIQLDSIVRL